jgi:hypothetical protein
MYNAVKSHNLAVSTTPTAMGDYSCGRHGSQCINRITLVTMALNA